MQTEPKKESITDQPAQTTLSTSSKVTIPAKHSLGPWRVLRNRNYALLFWGQLISSAGTQMQVVAVAMFVIGGPMLGQFESGLVAGLFTPEFSIVSGGLACIFATLAIVALVPSLIRVKVK